MVIEICANSVASALNAQKGGANRIELCSNLMVGGTTPSPGIIKLVRSHLDIEVFVLIRPRIGDFCYSELEFESIKEDLLFCKALNVDGVVVGMLKPDGTIDLEQLQQVKDLAGSMQITFHRAFDWVLDPFVALEQLIDLGIDRILTSGQKNTAYEGRHLLAQLIEQAKGRIEIMPGAGVNIDNIVAIAELTKAKAFHFSAKARSASKIKMETPKVLFNGGLDLPEFDFYTSDWQKVKAIVALFE